MPTELALIICRFCCCDSESLIIYSSNADLLRQYKRWYGLFLVSAFRSATLFSELFDLAAMLKLSTQLRVYWRVFGNNHGRGAMIV